MRIIFQQDPDIAVFNANVSSLCQDHDIHTILVLAAEGNHWSCDELDPILSTTKKTIIGGIFPQIIYQDGNFDQGAIVIGLPVAIEWHLMPQISDQTPETAMALDKVAAAWTAIRPSGTLMLFVDGLSSGIAKLISSLFDSFGLEENIFGGGAGSLSFQQKPCIITPDGLLMDCALILRLPYISTLGVAHGWQPISDSFKVTQSHKNQLQQLNWQPAFSIYKKIVESHSGQRFTDDNFFSLAKSYPLGINRLDADMVVRDPLMLLDNEAMLCVGDVPKGAFIRVLTGTKASLIDAAARASQDAQHGFRNATATPDFACFIDCISRVLFLQGAIHQELANVQGAYPLFGALTLGEIANDGQAYLEFYNKTAVLALLAQST